MLAGRAAEVDTISVIRPFTIPIIQYIPLLNDFIVESETYSMSCSSTSPIPANPFARMVALALMMGLFGITFGCNGGGKSERDDASGEAAPNAASSAVSSTASSTASSAASSAASPPNTNTAVNARVAPITDIGNNNPNLLVAIGDSITTGSTVSGPSYPARLSGILGKTVMNRGVNGATSAAAGSQANGALSANPSFLLIMLGTNDVFREVPPETVAANLRTAVNAARANKTIPVVATIPPNLRSDFQQGIVNSYNNRIKSMAGSSGARIADVAREFGPGTGLIQDDGYHPNDRGTAVIAFTFANAVRR